MNVKIEYYEGLSGTRNLLVKLPLIFCYFAIPQKLDPLGEMRKLYDYFGMTLTPETESAMMHYIYNDPKKTKYGLKYLEVGQEVEA